MEGAAAAARASRTQWAMRYAPPLSVVMVIHGCVGHLERFEVYIFQSLFIERPKKTRRAGE
jgi:hypothetical protein